jgi:tetratricopeptide (TPR) repeat protein
MAAWVKTPAAFFIEGHLKLQLAKLLSLSIAWPMLLSAQTARKSHIDDLIAGARAKVEKSPERAESFVDLANALARRARERSDPAFDREAEDAVGKALRLHPGDFEARKVRVIVRLHQHRFADALEEAQALNKEIPDDNIMYGLVADAQIGLGNYKEAEASAQRMIDMRQVNAPGLQRGAKLRELIGYPDGAIDWWGSALRLTSATDEEERAYIMVQMARLHRQTGKQDLAARDAQQALELVPNYPAGLTELALDRLAEKTQEKAAEAVELLRRRLAASPDLDSGYWLAEALARAHAPDASATAADFEKQALARARESGEASPLVIVYEAEHGNAAEAVRLAAQTAARRHDIETLESYAWALFIAKDFTNARKEIDMALVPGVRNAMFFYHAGMIAMKTNDFDGARKFFKQSLEIDAGSPYTTKVIEQLSILDHK